MLTRPIKWELIEQQYDQIVKYVTAVRLGAAEPEAIVRRFTRTAVQHPTYQAMAELGKVYKTRSGDATLGRQQQGLDRAALVHRAVALRHFLQGQGQVEDLAGVDRAVLDQGGR